MKSGSQQANRLAVLSVIDMMIQYEGKILLLFSVLVVSGAVPLTSNPIWTTDVVLYREKVSRVT